jgi:hypothetical protein
MVNLKSKNFESLFHSIDFLFSDFNNGELQFEH